MITKYGRGGVQGAMGLKIAKYDIAGLQIVIGLGLQSATKILKKWIKKCDGITNWYSAVFRSVKNMSWQLNMLTCSFPTKSLIGSRVTQ